METFRMFMEAVALKTGSDQGIMEPPTDDDTGGGGESWWNEEVHRKVWDWMKEGGPCFKKICKLVADTILRADEGYKPNTIQTSAQASGQDMGYGRIAMLWSIETNKIEFDQLEMALKQVLLRDCDLWKSLGISYDKAYNVLESKDFLPNFEGVLLDSMNAPFVSYISSQAKFATHEILRENNSHYSEMINKFMDEYIEQFKAKTSIDQWRVIPNGNPTSQYWGIESKLNRIMIMGLQKYTFNYALD